MFSSDNLKTALFDYLPFLDTIAPRVPVRTGPGIPGFVREFRTVDGVRLHWLVGGKADSALPPIVFLHGLNDSHLSWKAVAQDIARDRLVLIPDLPGHGLSDRPDASYALAWYGELMARWLVALDLPAADVVGHSFGGGVAQMMLLTAHLSIRRLVLVASGGLGREIAWVLRLASLPRVVERLGQPFMALGTTLALRYADDGRDPEDIAWLSGMNARDGSARAFARTVQDIIDWRGQRRTYDQRIHEIPALPPIAVIWGREDPIIPVAHARKITRSLRGSRVFVFKDCGHHPHCERPGAFSRTLRRYLAGPATPVTHA